MGRQPKNQNASQLKSRSIGTYFPSDSNSGSSAHILSSAKTRLISSYFQPSSQSSADPPSSPSHSLGPFSSPETGHSTPPIADATNLESTATSETVLSDIADSDAYDTLVIKPLIDPFNSQDVGDSNDTFSIELDDGYMPSSPGRKSAASEASSWRDEGSSDLSSIDSLGLMTFSSQLSGESLRRLALSPRKQKKKKELMLGLMSPTPALTFSEKLVAEMDDYDVLSESALSRSKPKAPRFGENEMDAPEKAVVEGSDSGSELEWNDDEISPTPQAQPHQGAVEDAIDALASDDDIPTLGKFTSKTVPAIFEDSDSDLDDHPFTSLSSSTNTLTPMTTPSADQHKGEDSSDLEALSDLEDKLVDMLSSKNSRRSTRASPPPRTGRSLRSSTVKQAAIDISPPRQTPKPKPVRASKKPLLFSLDSLLKEKKRKAEVGYDIKAASTQMTLDDDLIDEYDDEEDEDAFFGPEAIPKGVLSEEQEGALAEIIEEEESHLVEDIAEFFVCWPQDLAIQPLELEPDLSDRDKEDTIIQKIVKCTRTEAQRRQLLSSPFLMIKCWSLWPMPRSLFRWLVHVLAAEQSQPAALSVFALLQRVISQKTSVLGVDHKDLIRVFKMYGAKDVCLSQEWKVAPVTKETKAERLILPETRKFPRHNLKAVIKLVNITATLDPQFYDTAEIRKIMSLLMRMTTDPIIGDIKSLLGSTMVALLDAIPAGAWETERQRLCEDIIATLGTSLPFMLLALNQLPSLSLRITLLRRSVALAYLNLPAIPAGETAPNLEELHRALFVDEGFLINTETKYKDLGRRIRVFGLCLDDEQMIAAYGRKALEPLLKKLRHMHGRIVDVRAAFMERTLTKDMIQRLYMRLYYAGIHRQTAKQSTLNFGLSTAASANGQRKDQQPGDGQKAIPMDVNIADLRLVPELVPLTDTPVADTTQQTLPSSSSSAPEDYSHA